MTGTSFFWKSPWSSLLRSCISAWALVCENWMSRWSLSISLSSAARAVSLITPTLVSRLLVSAWSCLFLSCSSPIFLVWSSFSFVEAALPATEFCAIACTSTTAYFASCGNGTGGAGGAAGGAAGGVAGGWVGAWGFGGV